jgi:hypothetical protein
MSLKAVHLIFVGALSALAFGLGVWQLRDYFSSTGQRQDLLWAGLAFVAGGAVIYYGRYFLKKLRAVSYL